MRPIWQSAFERLGMVVAIIVFLWVCVIWAL